jgi:hypothetical protein
MFTPIVLGFGLFALYAMTYNYTIREISTYQNPTAGQNSLVED